VRRRDNPSKQAVAVAALQKGRQVGRYFGREPRYTRHELELQAQQALEARINLGRPPAEDFAPIEARLAQMDREMAARAAAEAVPPPPPLRDGERPLSVTTVRLPAGAKATAPPPKAAAARAPGKPRPSRQPVSAEDR
jgi:hypothetical protein